MIRLIIISLRSIPSRIGRAPWPSARPDAPQENRDETGSGGCLLRSSSTVHPRNSENQRPLTEASHSTIRRLQHGDVEALEEVFLAYGARIHSLCRRMTGNEADAQDLTQDVFLRVHRQAAKFSGRSRFSTWLFRLAVNHVRNFLRAESRRATSPILELREEALPPADGQLPEEVASRREEQALLDQLLQELPDDQRSVVLLRELEGMSYAKIADVLDIPLGTVTSRLVRARERLRTSLRKAHGNEEHADFLAGPLCPKKR